MRMTCERSRFVDMVMATRAHMCIMVSAIVMILVEVSDRLGKRRSKVSSDYQNQVVPPRHIHFSVIQSLD